MGSRLSLSTGLFFTLSFFFVTGSGYQAKANENQEKYYELPPEVLREEMQQQEHLLNVVEPVIPEPVYMSTVNDPALGYRVVVLVDKSLQGTSPTAQSMTIFVWDEPQGSFRFYDKWDVSTGVEKSIVEKIGQGENAKEVRSERKTPIGFYRSELLEPDHYSKAFDAHMPFTVFYDVSGGLGIHGIPTGATREYSHLGKRASHGCSRLTLEHAKTFFELVKSFKYGTVVKLNPDDGKVTPSNKSGRPITVLPSYRALIINTETSVGKPTLEVGDKPGETGEKITIDPGYFQAHPERIFDLFPKLHFENTNVG